MFWSLARLWILLALSQALSLSTLVVRANDITVLSSDPALQYSPRVGSWTPLSAVPSCAESAQATVSIGSSVTLRFNGTSIAINMVKNRSGAPYDVLLDGERTNYNSFVDSTSPQCAQEVRVAGLQKVEHNITVTHAGTPELSAGGKSQVGFISFVYTPFDPSDNAVSPGAIAGGVIGGVVVLGLLGFGYWWWRRRRVRQGNPGIVADSEGHQSPPLRQHQELVVTPYQPSTAPSRSYSTAKSRQNRNNNGQWGQPSPEIDGGYPTQGPSMSADPYLRNPTSLPTNVQGIPYYTSGPAAQGLIPNAFPQHKPASRDAGPSFASTLPSSFSGGPAPRPSFTTQEDRLSSTTRSPLSEASNDDVGIPGQPRSPPPPAYAQLTPAAAIPPEKQASMFRGGSSGSSASSGSSPQPLSQADIDSIAQRVVAIMASGGASNPALSNERPEVRRAVGDLLQQQQNEARRY